MSTSGVPYIALSLIPLLLIPCCAPSPVLRALQTEGVISVFFFRFKVGFIFSVFSYSKLENKQNPQQYLIIIQHRLTHIL